LTSNNFLNRSITSSIFAFPCCGGLTFRILQASSSVRPWEANVLAAPGLFFAWALAYCEDAEACFHASVTARPRTRPPVITTWVIIRCAWMS
jgi:hypothetical protein